ncbi:MAG TPA: hypothetical protein VIK92_06920, partial [Thermaerobacter sp.]
MSGPGEPTRPERQGYGARQWRGARPRAGGGDASMEVQVREVGSVGDRIYETRVGPGLEVV